MIHNKHNKSVRVIQGWIQDFFKEGVVGLRVQGKHPKDKGMGKGGGYGLCLNTVAKWFVFP